MIKCECGNKIDVGTFHTMHYRNKTFVCSVCADLHDQAEKETENNKKALAFFNSCKYGEDIKKLENAGFIHIPYSKVDKGVLDILKEDDKMFDEMDCDTSCSKYIGQKETSGDYQAPKTDYKKEYSSKDMIENVDYVVIGQKTTICLITTIHGFEIVGTSSCVYKKDFNMYLGREHAFNDARKQLDLLYAYYKSVVDDR